MVFPLGQPFKIALLRRVSPVPYRPLHCIRLFPSSFFVVLLVYNHVSVPSDCFRWTIQLRIFIPTDCSHHQCDPSAAKPCTADKQFHAASHLLLVWCSYSVLSNSLYLIVRLPFP